METCELCGRENVETTIHHLLSKEIGGTFGATAALCIPCMVVVLLLLFRIKKEA